jgi:hypothetical protein
MSNPFYREKVHRRYLFYRFYFSIALLVWFVFIPYEAIIIASKNNRYWVSDELVFLIPFVVPALYMLMDVGLFRFPYSILGKYMRTPIPGESRLYSKQEGFAAYGLYPSGLSISLPFGIRGFLPFELISGIEPEAIRGYRYSIRHSSPEFREPIRVRSLELIAALKKEFTKEGAV